MEKAEMIVAIKSHGYGYEDTGDSIMFIHEERKTLCRTLDGVRTIIQNLATRNKLALLNALGHSNADFARYAGVTQGAIKYPSPRIDTVADRWLREILDSEEGRERARAIRELIAGYLDREQGNTDPVGTGRLAGIRNEFTGIMKTKLALLRALGYSHADFARRAGVTQAALAYPSPRLDAAADRWLQEILGETTGRERAEALVGLVEGYLK